MPRQNELHQLSEKLVKTQEEERRSIARELHDEIGQSMSALLVDSILEHSRKNNPTQGITGVLCYSDELFIQAP